MIFFLIKNDFFPVFILQDTTAAQSNDKTQMRLTKYLIKGLE